MSTGSSESMWEALNHIRDNLVEDKVIFDSGFSITEHGKEEHSFFVVECTAWDYAWILSCDLSTGCWVVS